ncbi:hypothetical protein [Flavobacterium sp.]|uniref:hypothetical protein n=1 Tax=Flavobacterium sp. TaxID=239 RepID=UPI002614B64B|nr:hypothetical protein [Flavobacterium sp.]
MADIKFNYFFSDSIKAHIKFNKDISYSYYVDNNDKNHYQLSYKNSDSIKVYPYQYVLLYKIRDKNKNIIETFTMDCICKDKQLMLEGWSDLDEYLKPQIEVLKGNALSLDEVLIIAREKGFINVIEWEIDYQKK